MNIKIIVATHKKYWMPEDEVYIPLQVGAEGKRDLGYKRDNVGDNISLKNPNYTGHGRILMRTISGLYITEGSFLMEAL